MRYKILIAIALIGFVAVSCKKNNEQTQTPPPQNSQEQVTQEQPDTGIELDTETKVETTTPTPDHFSTEEDIEPVAQPEVYEVRVLAEGFSPKTLTIKKGDYVQFTNMDVVVHQPASDPHPFHTNLPGFESGDLKQSEKYRFQFNKVGTWGYHDHEHKELTGTIIVQ